MVAGISVNVPRNLLRDDSRAGLHRALVRDERRNSDVATAVSARDSDRLVAEHRAAYQEALASWVRRTVEQRLDGFAADATERLYALPVDAPARFELRVQIVEVTP